MGCDFVGLPSLEMSGELSAEASFGDPPVAAGEAVEQHERRERDRGIAECSLAFGCLERECLDLDRRVERDALEHFVGVRAERAVRCCEERDSCQAAFAFAISASSWAVLTNIVKLGGPP